ncbi:pyridoxamine 5'-phosphate oxidase family protein [Candidatus Xianfuyuplasma coldseepsis]|uniref:Uncharacterized protein n=1 Tax=Candidatus Xianfuyuplasma coldseepsis TaxID=2782163 RepID=A0A7L7KRQ2_9MOLU|nr:pyridoxamine 5'-phosphate oxidase family protein [Xianfuyuplasma coldseepsis]QMS84634.1 hypothetical protein G4Z02_02335 [Xianfuyuplasma coldseepsis]
MNKKALVKYRHDDERGLMHYVVFNGDVVVMSKYESKKVAYIEQNGSLDVTFDISTNNFAPVKIEVVTDDEYVMSVYNYMIETNNAYFLDGTEELCVLKFAK